MRSVLSPGALTSAPVRLTLLALVLSLSVAGCRRRAQPTDTEGETPVEATTGGTAAPVEVGPPPADWPRVLVVVPGNGPALYLGHEANAPAVGYLAAGTRVRLESSIVNGRAEVLVGGALATKGWVPVSRLGLYAQSRGRIEGTRGYLGPGDLVAIAGPDGEGAMRIAARPWLGGEELLDAMSGTFDAEQLGPAPPGEDAEGLSPGDCYVLPAGQTTTVYERPGGEAIANLPAMDPPMSVVVLRERNGWYGARIGHGPYITGYLQGELTACSGSMPEPTPLRPPGENGRPYWMSQEEGSLHRVASGTRVRFHGRTIARLRGEGWARELGRQDGDLVDVFLAADDGAAIRGLVEASALTLEEAAAETPEPEPEPEEELPDELQ